MYTLQERFNNTTSNFKNQVLPPPIYTYFSQFRTVIIVNNAQKTVFQQMKHSFYIIILLNINFSHYNGELLQASWT